MMQKLEKVSGDPIAYHLYRRRDLEAKIDKLAVGQLKLAKLIFSVAQSARNEHEGNENKKLQQALTRERKA